jgi:polyhydroxyalkanoate synthase
MHSEYLRKLFLGNDLASARYEVHGRPISLSNLRMPLFVVGTERDHIAPWRSVYKIHYLSDTDVTFVLASGGHNAGIVSEPGHPHRAFRMKQTGPTDMSVGPQEWVATAERFEGSWWPAWHEWLDACSSDARVAPPRMGSPEADMPALCDAPGTYVFQK